MTWLYYAGYQNAIEGERAVANLLDRGIAPEDISLVAKLSSDKTVSKLTVDYQPALAGIESERERIPSPMGDPSRRLEDVSGVEELDDAASVEENLAEPLNNQWYGKQEERDALQFAESGIIREDIPVLREMKDTAPLISSIAVGGEAVLLGDGKLALNLLADQIEHPDVTVMASLKRILWNLGLGPEAAIKLAECYSMGGAVLTVAETASAIPIQDVEALVAESSPLVSGTFVDTETVEPVPHF